MKRKIINILIICFALFVVACDDVVEDATSKHVYSEDESPYLRTDNEATITNDLEFAAGHIEPITIALSDYSDVFQAKMGMSVDQVISGVANGSVVFYNINITRGIWNKAAMTKGSTGWYYNTAGGVCSESDEAQTASIDIDTNAKALIVNMREDIKAGTILSFNIGFAIDNGADYDDYVRFAFNLSVTDPTLIITSITIPAGDYNNYGIDFNLYSETIQTCMQMSVSDFFDNLDYNGNTGQEQGGTIKMYMVDDATEAWDETSEYTAERPGYWINDQGVVCNWNDPGFSLYANTKNDDEILYIGRAPALASGTSFKISIGYKDTVNESNYFRFIITATLE